MKLSIPVLFEDTDVIIFDKPAGIVINRAESVKEFTLQDWVEQQYPNLFSKLNASDEHRLFRARSGMVHRLDKDTSGVLAWAKHPKAMVELMKQFHDRQVQKTYIALVHGFLHPATGSITLPMGRVSKRHGQFGVVIGGKLTETAYHVKNYYHHPKLPYGNGFCLMELYPRTGRTHQLRVMLKHLQHPIVGDSLYVGRKRSRLDEQWCSRQFLHAYKLQLFQPTTQKPLEATSELPPDLTQVLSQVTLKEE